MIGCVGEIKEDPENKDQTEITSDGNPPPPPSGDDTDQEEDDSANDSSTINTSSEGGTFTELEPDFSFSGISKIQATSDTKVTIWFPPVTVTIGDESYPAIPPQEDSETGKTDIIYMYEIVKDDIAGNSPPVASFPDAGLKLNSNGEFVVTVDIGETGNCGIYNVIARDINNNTKLNPRSYFKLCTYNYYFPKFDGIKTVEERQGCARETGAKLGWSIATRSDELTQTINRLNISKEEKFQLVLTQEISYSTYADFEDTINKEIARISSYSPTGYYIYWDTSENNLLERLEMSGAMPDATVTNINSTTFDLDGLENGQTYFIAVRSATEIVEERNGRVIDQNYHIIQFSVPAEEDVSFDGIAQVQIPPTIAGYSEAIVKFNPCLGCNQYRIWAFENEIPSQFDIKDSLNLKGSIDLDVTGVVDSFRVQGLQSHKTYYFKVAAIKMCDGATVQGYEAGLEGIGKTSPPLAPFNGISSVYSTGSLASLSMNWQLPDTSSGVFDEYRVFYKLNNGPVKEVFNSDINTETDTGYLVPRIANRFPLNNTSLTELTVSNLVAGNNPQESNSYCFAIGLKESDQLGEDRVGKTTSTEDLKFKCFNFHFTPPVFNGPNIGNCNSSSTSFNVNFDLPVLGTFHEARIYYKEYREPSDAGYLGEEDDFGIIQSGNLIDYDLVEQDTNFVKSNDLGVSETYSKNPWKRIVLHHTPDESPRLETPGILEDSGWIIRDDNPIVPIRGLTPDQWYVYAIELYYNPPDRDPFYIRPNRIEKCKTGKPNVVHSGWAHILSVGKKTNGLLGDKWIPEKLVFQNGPQAKMIDGVSIFDDKIKDSGYFFKEDTSIDPETGFSNLTNESRVTSGIVHLSWFDFKLSQSSIYANSLLTGETGDSVNDFYYRVERADNKDFIDSEDLPGEIPLRKGVFLYHYVDYLIPRGEMKYYYRVNLWKSGTPLRFSTFDENASEEKLINLNNSILEVVSPPPNMAFIHRFAINKTQCKKIDKSINHGEYIFNSITNDSFDYSDIEDGLNNKNPRGDLYLTPPSQNYDISKNYRCKYRGIGSTYDADEDEYYYDIGKSYLIDRFEMGANIGATQSEIDNTEGEQVDTAMDKCHYGELINGELVAEPAICSSSNFSKLFAKENTIAHSSGYQGGSIFIQTGRENLDNVWSRVDNPNLGQVSNSAYLPPLSLLNSSSPKTLCSSRKVEVSGTEHVGRLPSRQEYIFLGEPYEGLSFYHNLQIFNQKDTASQSFSIQNDLYHSCNTSTYNQASNGVLDDRWWVFPFRDEELLNNSNMTNFYPTSYVGNLTYNDTLFPYHRFMHAYKTGSFGEPNTFSSHLCVSKFGLQDVVGNVAEVTADYFASTADGTIYLDIEKTNYQEVRDFWKMTPFKLLTNEGSPYEPKEISIHNYYSSELGDFSRGYSGFNTVETSITSDHPYWNPIAGLNFREPETRSKTERPGSLIDTNTDSFYENFLEIITDLIFDDNINSPVADEDNFNFGNTIKATSGIVNTRTNTGPVKLRSKGDFEIYDPFYYEYNNAIVSFMDSLMFYRYKKGFLSEVPENTRSSRPLLFGGSGQTQARGNGLNGTSTNVKIYTNSGSYTPSISNYSTSQFDTLGGFRCIFPITDNED